MEIKIKDWDLKEDYQPKHSYEPKLRGQAAYILKVCEEKEIRADFFLDSVRIYSHKKLNLFKDIIAESIELHKDTPMVIQGKSSAFYLNGSLICVALRDEDSLYTFESTFHKVIENQYIGKLPLALHYNIFDTRKEMEDTLLSKGVLV